MESFIKFASSQSTLLDPPSFPTMKYDLFMNFQGGDARRYLVPYVCHEAVDRGLEVFMDEEGIETGCEISLSLKTAINESKIAILVISPNYASSPWCLAELAEIMRCVKNGSMHVIPVFYGVKPSDLRPQVDEFAEDIELDLKTVTQWRADKAKKVVTNQKSEFAKAFKEHEKRFGQETVNQWRAAFAKVADLSGLESSKFKSDRDLVTRIVESVCAKLQQKNIESGTYTGGLLGKDKTGIIKGSERVMLLA